MPEPMSSSASSVSTMDSKKLERPWRFSDKTMEVAAARSIYLKIFMGGAFMTIVTIFAVFSIFWGSLWKIPAHNLHGWVVDFDEGTIGQGVAQALGAQPAGSRITWTVVPASQFPGGPPQLGRDVLEEHTWVAVAINPGATARLTASISSPNSSYDGTEAITVYATEARNENAFRGLIRPSVQATLEVVSRAIAIQTARRVATAQNLGQLLTTSPQTVTAPVGYRIQNMAPFDQPVASAVTFVGLLYQLILSFFIVMIGLSAREVSGFERSLSTWSLIKLRLVSSFAAYFVIALFYSLLSLAFQLNVSRKFGHSGFLIFWMLNYAGMLAVGLALESLLTLLTTRGIPFFMLTWIITNVSVCVYPIEVMPHIFRYGHAAPFYNVSRAMRAIIFSTKNVVGQTFGILAAWIAISCITLPLIQIAIRRRQAKGTTNPKASTPEVVHPSNEKNPA
ncbi:hypothetical protein NLJ89_g2395 [Agrocybe chaxingu]|uniref:DUF3533 domain-containing protein n=1 Tax=Agrocybe chaxingu TaxID=84603 RepID=A0A9W8MY45_9AGAR|nr:hypothetical protein NLJ89_g2395 [Agrocybe chaxingu]